MREPISLKLAKWPFLLGDALLLGTAYFLFSQSARPMNHWEILGCVLAVTFGAALAVWPFVLEYRALTKLTEADGLSNAVAQIQNLEQLAAQIGSATAQWQSVQESADKTSTIARDMAQSMANEAKSFQEFMQRANDGEKATLRLEVEKLRRAEAEWLQTLVRMLDHTFALTQAAARSRQPGVAEQLSNFQNACRDAARRVGLTPFVAASAEPFDEQRHQLVEGDPKSAKDATVAETIATGYTFQGRLIRSALVRLQANDGVLAQMDSAPKLTDQSQLPLEATEAK
jgi:molecular chaperone GrpE (heat shock protein)